MAQCGWIELKQANDTSATLVCTGTGAHTDPVSRKDMCIYHARVLELPTAAPVLCGGCPVPGCIGPDADAHVEC